MSTDWHAAVDDGDDGQVDADVDRGDDEHGGCADADGDVVIVPLLESSFENNPCSAIEPSSTVDRNAESPGLQSSKP